jgi:two-component system sensor histidine kinase KdpD
VTRLLLDRRAGYVAAVLVVSGTIGALKLFPPDLADSTIALVLLLAVFVCAWVWESGPGTFAAVLATLGFNYFFIPPLYTFTIQDPRNVAALFVFLASGLLIGHLSALSRERLRLAEAERRDLATLTQLSQAFLSDTNREFLLGVAADRLRLALQAEQVEILLARENGELHEAAATPGAAIQQDLADLAYRQGNSAAFPSALSGIDIYLPIRIGVQRAGTLVARGMRSSERMAEGCALLLGLSLERERFVAFSREAEKTKTSDEMKSTLLAALAHDLKTPVTAASAAVENWEAAAGSTEGSRLALAELNSLSRRIAELMEVVRLDSGVARPRRERVTCGEIVEAAMARFGEALADHSLFLDVPSPELAVEVDPAQLTEALGHGLENAARYSPPGSEIRVSVAADDRHVRFRVEDSGTGIAPADRERVFERFVRLPDARDVPGTGLGLSIAKSLVELNGGELILGSSASRGTLFEIALPRAA